MLQRILKYSVKNILRNKFLSISSVLVLTLLMFFINILMVLHNVSFKLIDGISSKLTISLYLNENYDSNSTEVIDLKNAIKRIDESIQIEYKSKTEVLEEIRMQDPELVKVLERTNPLPDTINISEIELLDYETMNLEIQKRSVILAKNDGDDEYFSNYSTQYNNINKLIAILSKLGLGLYLIISVFFISIAIIIYSVVGNFIYYYRDEIYITRLVGGSKAFIYGPFVLQGVIYSFFAFVLSLVTFIFILKNTQQWYINIYEFELSFFIFGWEMMIFLFIGGISGYLSSKKYLK